MNELHDQMNSESFYQDLQKPDCDVYRAIYEGRS